jgi:hypothetical protein
MAFNLHVKQWGSVPIASTLATVERFRSCNWTTAGTAVRPEFDDDELGVTVAIA